MQNPEYARAGFGARMFAYLFDTLVSWLICGLILLPIWFGNLFSDNSWLWSKQILFNYSLYAIVAYCIRSVYFVFSTSVFHKTPGKKLMHIEVCATDGENLTFLNVLFRETVGRFLSGIFCIGYLFALISNNHLALHDMICDTAVCYSGLVEASSAKTGSAQQEQKSDGCHEENAGRQQEELPDISQAGSSDAGFFHNKETGSTGANDYPVPRIYWEQQNRQQENQQQDAENEEQPEETKKE